MPDYKCGKSYGHCPLLGPHFILSPNSTVKLCITTQLVMLTSPSLKCSHKYACTSARQYKYSTCLSIGGHLPIIFIVHREAGLHALPTPSHPQSHRFPTACTS